MKRFSFTNSCLGCSYFRNDSHFLEDEYAGLKTLSSGWGCVRGDAGICVLHNVYLFPRGKCKDFRQENVSVSVDTLG